MISIILVFFLLFIYVVHNSVLESIPLVFGGIIYYLLLTIILFVFIYNLIKIFVNRKKLVKIIFSLVISLILIVIMVIYYERIFDSLRGKGYLYTLNYKRVKEGLDDNFKTGYKVLGVKDKNVKVSNDTTCEYVYDISLNDGSGIVFQAYYCSFAYMGIIKSFKSNYDYYYLSYYLDLYKKNNNVNFTLENNDNIYSHQTIIYNNSNKEDVTKFLYYFDDNTIYKEYQIILKNEDNNRISYINNRNDFNYLR